ncbi:GGDEF domain-containing protein [Alkalihalobacterium alkalinitrilicum]|uniref:GGDEF domain-containing protein n=1 Tax=Alkalihalobacterium alkalinitrilicum TaxID=427920 RepID=UPI000995D573|nr:GGDEF domain-containing protein [Alkalihalobacterium alkalinitrilicum]
MTKNGDILTIFPLVYIVIDDSMTIKTISGRSNTMLSKDTEFFEGKSLSLILDTPSLYKLKELLQNEESDEITTELNFQIAFEIHSFQAFIRKIDSLTMILLTPLSQEYLDTVETIMKISSDLSQLNSELMRKNKIINEQKKELEKLSFTDSLTGLYNRRQFNQAIQTELIKAKRKKYPITILMIDLNNFKEINDTFGHDKGDHLLQGFATITKRHIRHGLDFAFRTGGDEFLLILTDCDEKEAIDIGARLNKEFQKITDISSISYGAVSIPYDDDTKVEAFIQAADQKMYEFKKELKRDGAR